MDRITLTTRGLPEYDLLDSGEGQKLERYGSYVLARPDPQALWEKGLNSAVWEKADGRYERSGIKGEWRTSSDFPNEWKIDVTDLRFKLKATSFKHTGIFPEQVPNWIWSREVIRAASSPVSVLNLFGYTGGATLAALKEGASVTHVDASKTAVQWARHNAVLCGLDDSSVRWIVEDATLFVKRELKRGRTYDAIIMDPPAFGHGPQDELWKIEEDLLDLIRSCKKLLSEKPRFFLINGYAAGYSSLAFAYNIISLVQDRGGVLEHGDLTIEEKESGRLLPCGIFSRWKGNLSV